MGNLSKAGHYVLGLILLCVVAVRFAEPIQDGDLFWQMAYGKYMVQHLTLVPDHTLYSWSPTSRDTIYCAWIAEILLYGCYALGGYPLLFALRYLVIGATLLLAGDFIRRSRVGMRAEFYLYLLVGTLAVYVGSIVKPELFSLLFFHLLYWGYFRMKLECREESGSSRWRWYFPLLMMVWVNTHGVFVFGMLALVLMLVGETLNLRFSPRLAMPSSVYRIFASSVGLSVLACLVNPYGYRYPWQLLGEFLGLAGGTQSGNDAIAYSTLGAHQSILAVPDFHFTEMLGLMVIITGGYLLYLWRSCPPGARFDWGAGLLNLGVAALSVWYVRTTYYWPPCFIYSCVFFTVLRGTQAMRPVAENSRWWVRLPGLSVLAYLLVAVLASFQAMLYPYANSFFGFGIAYWNPVYEAEWVARFAPEARIYNDYDNGGYLAWRLYPQTRVMIDSRSFPFRSWYREYNAFENGRIFHELLDRMEPANIAVISHKNYPLAESFLKSGEWKLAFMGPSAGVYVRPDAEFPAAAGQFAPDRFDSIRNLNRGLDDFAFALRYGHLDEAFAIVKGLAKNLGYTPQQSTIIHAMTTFKAALEAEKAGHLDKAIRLQEQCLRDGVLTDKERLMTLYNRQLADLQSRNQGGAQDARIRDLAIRMQSVNQGQLPPEPQVSPESEAPASPSSTASPAASGTSAPGSPDASEHATPAGASAATPGTPTPSGTPTP